MNKRSSKSGAVRFLSLLLALAMVFSVIPPMHVHAASASLIVTNAEGEETDTFVVGEPIFVEASGMSSDDWLELRANPYPSKSHFWTYVDGKTNLFDAADDQWRNDAGFWAGMWLKPGTYEIWLNGADSLLKTITLEEPESTDVKSLELIKDTIVVGEPLQIKATNYSEYSWVGIYSGDNPSGNGNSLAYYYCLGHNDLVMDFELNAGDYTIIMYNDYDGTDIESVLYATVEGEKIRYLTTDKTEYKFGEPIMVTSQMGNPNWIGLYKQSDANPTGAGPTSMFWLYPTAGTPVDILSGEQQRHSEFTAGTYKVLLLDANYGLIDAVENIVITTEIDESKTVTVAPTCENDGSITYTYTDGTTKTVTAAEDESLKALGHDFENQPYVYDKELKKHYQVCGNDVSHHSAAVACTFDEGVVTKEPENGVAGEKTFTCTVCKGTRVEPYTAKQEISREQTKAPTCEDTGIETITYDDGTTSEVEIPKLGHNWGDWVYNEETKSHSRVCANADHPETAECEFVKTGTSNGFKYTCPVCQGSYEEYILTTDKVEYALGEKILITVNKDIYDETANDWVGIWEQGLTYSDKVSIYYYYPAEQGWDGFNVYDSAWHQRDHIAEGKYTIRLFANDGYTEIANMDVTVGPAVVVSSVTTQPTCEDDGYITHTYTDNSTQMEYPEELKALGHAYDESKWTYDATTQKHYHVCGNDASHHSEAVACTFGDGVVTKEPENGEAGEMTYTCTECGGTYVEPYTGKQEVSREQTKEPTCEVPGEITITYSDGTTTTIPVAALGHSYGEWVFDETTRTHVKTCANDTEKEHLISENCKPNLTRVQDQKAYFSCSECGGSYNTSILTTDKAEYAYGDPIMVTSVSTGDGRDWVGIYKKGETYNPDMGGSYSIYWYYVPSGVHTAQINVPANDQNGRGGQFTAGEYTVVLFADDTYSPVTQMDITITAELLKTEREEPTCEGEGAIISYYSDGTTKREPVPARGHDYSTIWTFDEATRKHYHVCLNDNTHTGDWTDCEFDDGEIVTEATENEPGVKKYTCEVCGGSYTQAYYNKVIVSEGVLIAATCEADGVYRYTYADDTHMDVPILKLGHSYGNWVYDETSQTHARSCANDNAHVESAPCSFNEGTVSNGEVTRTCSVCGGVHVSSILISDKDTYSIQDNIMVTAFTELPDAWVGLYAVDDDANPNAGGKVSYYWYWVNGDGHVSGTAENILNHYNTDRGEDLVPGEYKLLLFADGGYDSVIATKYITIADDGNITNYEVKVNGTVYENGAQIEYPAGTNVEITVTADGRVGNAWVGVYTNKVSIDTQFSAGTPSAYWDYISNVNGATIDLGSKINLDAGNYSVVVFTDGGYDNPVTAVNFTIVKEASNVQIIKEPTCTDYGVQYVTYEDGTSTYEPIDPLGHDFESGAWAYDQQARTHTRTCDRCTEVVTYACYFSQVEIVKEAVDGNAGTKRYTCETCGGSYEEAYYLTEEKNTEVSRIYGDNRFETALGIAEEMKKNLGVEKFSTIMLASGANFADALSGAYLANIKNAPILLCYNDTYDAKTVEYVKENLKSGGTVYILGGEKAVSGSVDAMLNAAGIFNVKRLAGENRFETNLLILKEAGVTGGEIMVCTGANFADVLSASAVEKPMLLVYQELSKNQKDFMSNLSIDSVYIIGGKNAVSYAIEGELKNYTNTTMRLGGSTRYETSVLIAERFFSNPDKIVLSYGMNFPDGLCGGQLASSLEAPVILTQTGSFAAAAQKYAAKHNITSGVVLGGSSLISNETVRNILQMESSNSITDNYVN